jgi:hypothetical protein
MKRTVALALLLAACSSEESNQQMSNSAVTGQGEENQEVPPAPNGTMPVPVPGNADSPPAVPAPNPPPTPDSEKSPEAAAKVLERYFAAVATRRYGDAYRLWGNNGEATGMTLKQFADSFAKYRDYDGNFGKPGPIEGAAGSAYIEFPVKVTGVLAKGGGFVLEGPMTLRRVNDVDGSTAEQRRWHIASSGLKPRPSQTAYRFIGKWAANKANCQSKAWTFTADGVRTTGPDCRFTKVAEAAGGYDVSARCTPGGSETIRIRFAESAKAMLVKSRALGDVGLTRCG